MSGSLATFVASLTSRLMSAPTFSFGLSFEDIDVVSDAHKGSMLFDPLPWRAARLCSWYL